MIIYLNKIQFSINVFIRHDKTLKKVIADVLLFFGFIDFLHGRGTVTFWGPLLLGGTVTFGWAVTFAWTVTFWWAFTFGWTVTFGGTVTFGRAIAFGWIVTFGWAVTFGGTLLSSGPLLSGERYFRGSIERWKINVPLLSEFYVSPLQCDFWKSCTPTLIEKF